MRYETKTNLKNEAMIVATACRAWGLSNPFKFPEPSDSVGHYPDFGLHVRHKQVAAVEVKDRSCRRGYWPTIPVEVAKEEAIRRYAKGSASLFIVRWTDGVFWVDLDEVRPVTEDWFERKDREGERPQWSRFYSTADFAPVSVRPWWA